MSSGVLKTAESSASGVLKTVDSGSSSRGSESVCFVEAVLSSWLAGDRCEHVHVHSGMYTVCVSRGVVYVYVAPVLTLHDVC